MTGGSARGRLFRFGWEHRLRDDPAVGGLTQEVLFVMASFADPDGTLRVSEERVAECIVKNVRTARKGIAAAQESGYVERLTRGHNVPGKPPVPSRYRLMIPATAVEDAAADPAAGSCPETAATGVQPDDGDRLRVVDEPTDDAELTG